VQRKDKPIGSRYVGRAAAADFRIGEISKELEKEPGPGRGKKTAHDGRSLVPIGHWQFQIRHSVEFTHCQLRNTHESLSGFSKEGNGERLCTGAWAREKRFDGDRRSFRQGSSLKGCRNFARSVVNLRHFRRIGHQRFSQIPNDRSHATGLGRRCVFPRWMAFSRV
jgi:hypothetical protein